MENQLLLILFSFILAFSLIIYIDIPYFFNFPLYPIFLCLFFSCPSFYSVLNSFTVFPRSIFSTFYLFSSTLQKKNFVLFFLSLPSIGIEYSGITLPTLSPVFTSPTNSPPVTSSSVSIAGNYWISTHAFHSGALHFPSSSILKHSSSVTLMVNVLSRPRNEWEGQNLLHPAPSAWCSSGVEYVLMHSLLFFMCSQDI